MKSVIMPTTLNDFTAKYSLNLDLNRLEDDERHHWDLFGKAKTDLERFRVVDRWFGAYEALVELDPNGKSVEKSETARNRGNDLFAAGKLEEALVCYNEAILLAPWPERRCSVKNENVLSGHVGSSLSLAFANRSAVFHRMQRIAECVADVDRAIAFGYPREKLKKLILRKARAFIEAEYFEHAGKCLDDQADELGLFDKASKSNSLDGDPEYEELLQKALEGYDKQTKAWLIPCIPLKPRWNTASEMAAKVAKLQLKNGRHPQFPALSSCLKLAFNGDVGRHMVAMEDISAGDVLAIEGTYVDALYPSSMKTHCYGCSVWTDAPLPCKGCSKVIFCSDQCANGSKAEFHKKECSFLWMFECPMMPDGKVAHVIGVMRTLLKKTAEEWSSFAAREPGNLPGEADDFEEAPIPGVYRTDDYDNVFRLDKGSKKRCVQSLFACAINAVYVMKVLEKAGCFEALSSSLKEFLGAIAVRHFSNYVLTEDFLFEWSTMRSHTGSYADCCGPIVTGFAVRPTLNLFGRRSCHANIMEATFGDALVVRASQPIKKGEPIVRLGPAFYVTHSRSTRRSSFKALVFYDCPCRACKEHWPTKPEAPESRGVFTVQCKNCPKQKFVISTRCPEEMSDICPECGWGAWDDLERLTQFSNLGRVHDLDQLLAITPEATHILEPATNIRGELYLKLKMIWGKEGNTTPVARPATKEPHPAQQMAREEMMRSMMGDSMKEGCSIS